MLPATTDNHLWVSWEDYHRSIELLALKVHESGWRFDHILCLARGGVRPGDVFSRIFAVPLTILATSSYREAAGTVRGALDIAGSMTGTGGPLAGRVLLIDDLVDSGVTLARVRQHVMENCSAISEMKSAVIWVKGCSSVRPDYFLHELPHDPWIHQPFEAYDEVRPHHLAARVAGAALIPD